MVAWHLENSKLETVGEKLEGKKLESEANSKLYTWVTIMGTEMNI